ncbi:hypothetical protein QT231_18275 [Halomonas sp. SpR1]|uniref:hypothetical protein n=1 Tax=Halomonas sp. SpR1 TaxID=3050462 RepID=UPI0027E4DEB1|nr:hypothetical protein [Halomonas sp. SpR1]MDQ7734660.1 hypothetical protein [Halomonas sp. SpR1]
MEIILVAIIFVAVFGFFSAAINDRKAARKAGEPTGSLRWHFKQYIAKEDAKKRERKAAKQANKQQKPTSGERVFSRKGNDLSGTVNNKPSVSPTESRSTKTVLPLGALRFTYEDFNGGITHREVTNWKEEGDYIKGFCLDRRDTRTFRKDRIIAFSEGEHLLKGVTAPSYSRPRPTTSKPIVSSKPMEILFTGFPKEKRASLEAQAADEGMLVRTRVTKALDFLCVGPKAAPSKQVEAEHRGATVLDEMAFYDLVESGELPDR